MIHLLYRSSWLPFALFALTGCSTSIDQPEQQGLVAREDFSAEEKRIARALSMGGHDVQGDATPQYAATLCGLALAAIEDRMQDGLLSAEQRKAFNQAQAIFERRSAAGVAPKERENTLNEIEQAYPDSGDRARFAVGCLRDLT